MAKRKQMYFVLLRFGADFGLFFIAFTLVDFLSGISLLAGWKHTFFDAEIVAAVLTGFRNPWLFSQHKRKSSTERPDEGDEGTAGSGVPISPILPSRTPRAEKFWYDDVQPPTV